MKGSRLLGVLTVHLVGGDIDKQLDLLASQTSNLQQSMSAQRVGASELDTVSKTIVDVRLRREVQHSVDFVLSKQMTKKIRRQNVSLDEFPVGLALKRRKILP